MIVTKERLDKTTSLVKKVVPLRLFYKDIEKYTPTTEQKSGNFWSVFLRETFVPAPFFFIPKILLPNLPILASFLVYPLVLANIKNTNKFILFSLN